MRVWSTTRRVDMPAPTSPLIRFNDHSLEILIAVWRVIALSAMVAAVVTIAAAALVWNDRLLAAAVAFAALAAGFGYLGFWTFGNEDWWPPLETAAEKSERRAQARRRSQEWGADDVHP